MALMTLRRAAAGAALLLPTLAAVAHAQDASPPEARCTALARLATATWPDSSTVIESANLVAASAATLHGMPATPDAPIGVLGFSVGAAWAL